jgi:isochorismate hydrolase
MILRRARSQLLLVDIQEKLAPAVAGLEALVAKVRMLAAAAKRLDIPITISEQYPKGLGPTLAAVREAAGNAGETFAKVHFSCIEDAALAARFASLRAAGRDQLVIAGMEAHVCVAQTALGAVREGYETFVAADAVSSRSISSKELALERLRAAGCGVIDAEMALFEWLEQAGTPEFRDLQQLIK